MRNYLVETVVVPIFIFLLVCFFVGFSVYSIKKSSCSAKAKQMEVSHIFGPFTGCMIKVGDKWWPIEKYIRMEN